MKATFALSALFAGALAADFRLVISKAASKVSELQGESLIFQSNTLFVDTTGNNGVIFNGADGTLNIQNGDPVYADKNGQLKIREYQKDVPSDGLTQGFTTGTDNTLKWAQGNIYTCTAKKSFSYGNDVDAAGIFVDRPGVKLPNDCILITLSKKAA
ncbi:hypothetical protein NW762_010786 [Fusarium torreyae]|uniref:Cell wall protein n=1 Tax=Fusarium torreyae TaxID=1237075 RepID=A0A9W8RT72_9HYPO|nr:hypothetical protein NW762_010786 [Fusarium torreyae]